MQLWSLEDCFLLWVGPKILNLLWEKNVLGVFDPWASLAAH